MLYRFQLDLAIPEATFNAIPAIRKQAFRDEVRALKAFAVKVGEEMTVRAVWHKCRHDEGNACSEEQEI